MIRCLPGLLGYRVGCRASLHLGAVHDPAGSARRGPGGAAGQGIPTAIHYPVPMHLQPAYRGWGEGPGSLPVSERLSRQVLCLPMHADLDEPTAMRIARAVRDAVGG